MKYILLLGVGVLIASLSFNQADNPITEEQTVETAETSPVEAVSEEINTDAPNEPVEAENTQTEAPVAPESQIDPQGCEPEMYWAQEPPHNCIPKSASSATKSSTTASSSGGCDSFRHLVGRYDWNVDTMMYAMRKESSCDPNAVGDNYAIRGVLAPSCGLLQVRTLPGRPSCEALKDPETNIQVAYNIWKGQGYRAWTTLH